MAEVHLEAAMEEAKVEKKELFLAQLDTQSILFELNKGAKGFKEVFLKSEELGEIVAG